MEELKSLLKAAEDIVSDLQTRSKAVSDQEKILAVSAKRLDDQAKSLILEKQGLSIREAAVREIEDPLLLKQEAERIMKQAIERENATNRYCDTKKGELASLEKRLTDEVALYQMRNADVEKIKAQYVADAQALKVEKDTYKETLKQEFLAGIARNLRV